MSAPADDTWSRTTGYVQLFFIYCCSADSFYNSQGSYLNWVENNRFQSMLPKDTRRHRDTAAAAAAGEQTRLNSHLRELPPKERVIPYTDDLFHRAAMAWLVSTDQVSGLYHNSSVAYMNLTTANSGVSAPSLSKND